MALEETDVINHGRLADIWFIGKVINLGFTSGMGLGAQGRGVWRSVKDKLHFLITLYSTPKLVC